MTNDERKRLQSSLKRVGINYYIVRFQGVQCLLIQRSKRVSGHRSRANSPKPRFAGVEPTFLPVNCNLPVNTIVIVVVSSLSGR